MNPIVITSAFLLLLLLTEVESSEYKEINKKLENIENNRKDLDEIIQTSEVKIKYDELVVEMEENKKKLELLQKELEQELAENKKYQTKNENVETELTEVQKEKRILRTNNKILDFLINNYKIIISVLLVASILIYMYRRYRSKPKSVPELPTTNDTLTTSNKTSAHYKLERILVGGKVIVLLIGFVIIPILGVINYIYQYHKNPSDEKTEEELQKTINILKEISFWIVTILFLVICLVILYMKSKHWKVVVTESKHTLLNFFGKDKKPVVPNTDIRMDQNEQDYTDSLAWWMAVVFMIQIILLVVSKYTDNVDWAIVLLNS